MRGAINSREYAIREVRELANEGLVTHEVADTFEERKSGHRASDMVLDPDLVDVLASWNQFGEPCTVFAGMSMAVVDERAKLYIPRISLLDRSGASEAAQEIYLRLWAALDEELIQIRTQQASDALGD